MTKYRVKKLRKVKSGTVQYLIEKRKQFLWWSWWSVVKQPMIFTDSDQAIRKFDELTETINFEIIEES